MLIDWFTVFAQIVNFLILVYLLKRFLYGPIIAAMQRREEKIAARLKDADDKRAKAEEESDAYRKKGQELDEKREQLLEEAKREAEEHRKKLVHEARKEVSETRSRWREAILHEQEAFLKDLKVRTGSHIYHIARRALADLSESDLEQEMIRGFLKRLPGIDEEMRKRIAAVIGKSGGEVAVRSAFEIPGSERQRITRAVHDLLEGSGAVRYETCPDLLCGLELATDGYVVGWNLDSYLKGLEEDIKGLLEEGLPPERKEGGE